MPSRFSPTEFVRAKTTAEVVRTMRKYGEKALVLGGGTMIHGLEARGALGDKQVLVDIQRLGLEYVKRDGKGLRIGAMTTFAELEESSEVRNNPSLGAIADSLTYPPTQIKNLATVGGSVASSFPAFDVPVALTALDGVVRCVGPAGKRAIPLGRFFKGYFENALKRGEFITELEIPRLPPKSSSAFIKLETNADDLAIVNVGARLTLDAAGVCGASRIVVGGGVGERPVNAVSCEKALKGVKPSERAFADAGEAVTSDVKFQSDQRTSARYRAAVAKVMVKRTLQRALERSKRGREK